MVQQTRKTIVVTGETFETLKGLGTVTESFNDVILRLIEKYQEGQRSPAIQQ
jgi:predicted CopG family antitoxin